MRMILEPGSLYSVEALTDALVTMFENPVRCGYPSAAGDVLQKPIDLNQILIRDSKTTFVFVAQGSSMEGEHIPEGALLVVDTSIRPRTGHIVLAEVDGEYTLKKIDFKLMRLIPANPAFEPIVINEGTDLRIIGVVTSIIINPYLPFVSS